MSTQKYHWGFIVLASLFVLLFYGYSSRTRFIMDYTKETALTNYGARNISGTIHVPNYINNPFKIGDEMALLHNLCMEPNNGVAKLVVYSAKRNGSLKIYVKGGPHFPHKSAEWTVELTTLSVPNEDNYTISHAAYFVTTTSEGNLHHFWKDTVYGLYGAMKVTKTLGSNIPSQLYYYADVWALNRSDGSHGPNRYQDILFALPVKKEHVYFKKARPHSCFDNAIFGFYNRGYSMEEKYNYFMKAFDITCQPHGNNRKKVTIINRKTRSISNVDELQKMSEKAGFETKVVNLGSLLIREQFALMMCDTDILVGVQGAGLRWIDFLQPKKSALLELTWKHWGSFYARQASSQGKKSATLEARTVTLDLPSYFKNVPQKVTPPVNKELLARYYKKGPVSEFDNHWKYANGTFDPEEFLKKLNSVTP